MNLLSELVHNSSRAYQSRLQPRFHALSSLVGFLGVVVSSVPMYFVSMLLSRVLGVDLDAPARTQSHGTLWVLGLICLMPVVLYLSCASVAGLFGAMMVRLGHFSPQEAKYYALRSRCPDHWFRDP